MIKSMTGFGSHTVNNDGVIFTVEIKSINSKQFDFTAKLPVEFRDKENEVRQLVLSTLERGKIECTVIKESHSHPSFVINKELIKNYFQELKIISKELNISETDDMELLGMTLKMPEIFSVGKAEDTEQRWNVLKDTILETCQLTNHHREQEGKSLEEDFKLRIRLILEYLSELEQFETERIQSIKSRLMKIPEQISFDENRLEQELIFYLEKLDFTEEKIRLLKHCDYFIETLDEPHSNGKKLSFICQEMGREINTLGAKSSHAEIQRYVVQMKDELEKIKEQLANVL